MAITWIDDKPKNIFQRARVVSGGGRFVILQLDDGKYRLYDGGALVGAFDEPHEAKDCAEEILEAELNDPDRSRRARGDRA